MYFIKNFYDVLRIWILPELCEPTLGLGDPLLGHVLLIVEIGVGVVREVLGNLKQKQK